MPVRFVIEICVTCISVLQSGTGLALWDTYQEHDFSTLDTRRGAADPPARTHTQSKTATAKLS